jgi:hypothetical protein
VLELDVDDEPDELDPVVDGDGVSLVVEDDGGGVVVMVTGGGGSALFGADGVTGLSVDVCGGWRTPPIVVFPSPERGEPRTHSTPVMTTIPRTNTAALTPASNCHRTRRDGFDSFSSSLFSSALPALARTRSRDRT